MLKIFDNYYLDASSVCYMLKKAHVKGDGMEECDVCTYHTRLEEALAEAVHQLVEAFQLIAVVVGPDRDGGGQLASAAGSAAQRHGGAQQQTDGRTKDSFHYIISPIPTKRLTEKPDRVRRVLSFLK